MGRRHRRGPIPDIPADPSCMAGPGWLGLLQAAPRDRMTIHPSALVSPAARLAGDVEIGPFAVIDGEVVLGAGVKIAGHAWVRGDTVLGEGTTVGWGAVIGADPQDLGFDPATPSGVRVGARNRLREYVTIHRGSKPGAFTVLGDDNFLMTGVHLGHDSQVGHGNVLANNVLFGGHVRLGNRAFLGGGAGFHQFVHIGDLAMVQGNASVSQDVPPYCVAHDLNQLAGLNTVGLRRAGFDSALRLELKRLYHQLFRAPVPLSQGLAEAAAMAWSPAAALLLEAVANPSRKGVIRKG